MIINKYKLCYIKISVMRDVTRAVAEYMIYHLNCCKLSSSWTRKSFDLYLLELYGSNFVFQAQTSKVDVSVT